MKGRFKTWIEAFNHYHLIRRKGDYCEYFQYKDGSWDFMLG